MAKKKKFAIYRVYGDHRTFLPVLIAYHNDLEIKVLKSRLEDYDIHYTFLTFMNGVNAVDAYRTFKRRIMRYYRYNIVNQQGKSCVLYGIRLSSSHHPKIPLFISMANCAAHVRNEHASGRKVAPKLTLPIKRPVVKSRKYNRSKIKSHVFSSGEFTFPG
jgi:hypothetical protein